jgi:hypothetical protein
MVMGKGAKRNKSLENGRGYVSCEFASSLVSNEEKLDTAAEA